MSFHHHSAFELARCTGKAVHPSWDAAKREADRLTYRHHAPFRVYKCPCCVRLHVEESRL